MTIEQAISYLENMKWLKGYDNTTVNGKPLDGVIDGIIELLKAQEPRIVTKHDFEDETRVDIAGALPVWVEYRRDEEWGEYWEDTDDGWATVREHNFEGESFENESHRCWTSRPTDAQREATPWNA